MQMMPLLRVLLQEIETLGFTPIVRDEFHCVQPWNQVRCARLQNIAFWVTEPGPNAVLLLSHHDSVPAGPGAPDDGAGVAASLEIASLMTGQNLKRPMLVLITDGEELGLMGANLFIEKDPLSKMVGAVVNMEARGVSGLSALIQTSRPNGRDLETLASQTRLPAASSLNADIHELLPNDTDMTEFLSLPVDAANLAYAGDVAFYHTPGDNLANMDRRSLFNMGAAGLAATQTFLSQSGDEVETQHLYVDILGLFVLTLPLWAGGMFIALGGGLSLPLLWQQRKQTQLWRVLLILPLAIVAGLGLAMSTTWLVDLIRPESLFGLAYPIALRSLHAAAALTGAVFIYTFLSRTFDRKALLLSAWLWTSLLGLLAFLTVPGAAIVSAPSMLVFGVASLMFLLDKQSLALGLATIGALVFAIITLPLTALGESGLFIEASAPFAIILILLFAYIVPVMWPAEEAHLRSFWIALVGTGSIAGCCLIAALLVPAYSKGAPRALSIAHIQSPHLDNAYWSIAGTEPVPEDLQTLAPFTGGELPGLGGPRQIAPAPGFAHTLDANITTEVPSSTTKLLTLAISAPETDRLTITINSSQRPEILSLNGQIAKNSNGLRRVMCSGRACRNAVLQVYLPSEAEEVSFEVISARFGLGPEGQNLLNARPDWAIPRQIGDTRVTYVRLAPPR